MWNQTENFDAKGNPTRPGQGMGQTDKRADINDGRQPNLGRTIVIKGEVTGSEDLAVDGQIEGKIDLPEHVLTIGPNAAVQADVKARIVMIFGTVVGSVSAREKVEVRLGGSVDGQLSAPRLVIQDGAYVSGKVEMPKGPRAAATKPEALAPVA